MNDKEQTVGEIVPMEQVAQEWAADDAAARVEAFLTQARAALEANPATNFTMVALPPGFGSAQLQQYLQLCAVNPGIPIMHLALNIPPELLAKFQYNGQNQTFVQGAVNAALEGLTRYLRRTPGGGLILPNGAAGPLRIAPMPAHEN